MVMDKHIISITPQQSLGGVQGDLFKGQPCWGSNPQIAGQRSPFRYNVWIGIGIFFPLIMPLRIANLHLGVIKPEKIIWYTDDRQEKEVMQYNSVKNVVELKRSL